ncbi:MAG TPA: hypothetical protein DCE33_14070, partial [Rhodospirillaceae bacterium]|nr:hypothetical protein [Rhodospirillaceae bacterium]
RRTNDPTEDIRIIQPSGVLVIAADVENKDDKFHAKSVTFYRTQRRLFEGNVFLPASKVPNFIRYQEELGAAAE